jgi:beta-galactosidase
VTFEVTGAGTLAGVSSADLNNADSYQAKSRKLFQGRAQVIVRATHKAGTIEIRATAEGLAPHGAKIEAR